MRKGPTRSFNACWALRLVMSPGLGDVLDLDHRHFANDHEVELDLLRQSADKGVAEGFFAGVWRGCEAHCHSLAALGEDEPFVEGYDG